MSRNLFAQIKDLRTHQQAGAFSASQKEATKQMLLEAIGHEEHLIVEPALQSTGSAAFFRWTLRDIISAPLATTAAIFVFVLGGWLTAANAASNSLPGDTLYSLKLVTEQAQLQLASLEDRAVLHTEFAQRRLSEAVAVGNSQNPEKNVYVSSTLQAYKKEMTLAEGDLRELSQAGSEQTAEIASAIDQKITQLTSALATSVAGDGSASNTSVSVTEAQDATESASQAVVDVLVDAQDTQASGRAIDLEKVFRDALADVEHRQTFDLGRIAKIRTVLAAHPELDPKSIPQEKVLKAFEIEISAATTRVPDAMDALAAGGSRTAFDALATMKTALRDIESRIAAQELLIAQAIAASASANVVTPPVTNP